MVGLGGVKGAVEKEGFPPQAIERLHYYRVYSTCAHVDEWEVEAAIKRFSFSFLRKDLPTWRVFITNGKETMAHLEETLHLPFLNTGGARPQYLASEQACKYLRSFG